MTWHPPVIPDRLPGWEHAFVDFIATVTQVPFAWGLADCITRVADLCAVETGVNPWPAEHRSYSSAIGAGRVLSTLGFSDVGDALAAVFREIPVGMARRGDCGVAEVNLGGNRQDATFIIIGAQAIASNERGPVIIQALQLRRAFAIGWS